MGLLRRWVALEPPERRIVLRAFLALSRVFVALRLVGFRRVFVAIERRKWSLTTPSADDLRWARSYARWIDAVARHHIVSANCLERTVVLHDWLRREGLASVLRIGVRTERGVLSAHAWVELGGETVSDRPGSIDRFHSLDGLAAAAFERGDDLHHADHPVI